MDIENEDLETAEESDTAEEQLEKMQKALERYKKENRKFRERIESLEKDESNPWRARALKAEAQNALAKHGIKETDRLSKYINLDNVSLDEEGNLVGLDEQIDSLKEDFPELFDLKKRAGGKADIFAEGAVKEEKSLTERQVDALFR